MQSCFATAQDDRQGFTAPRALTCCRIQRPVLAATRRFYREQALQQADSKRYGHQRDQGAPDSNDREGQPEGQGLQNLVDDSEHGIGVDRVAGDNGDRADRARRRRHDFDLHFHGLHHQQGVILRHVIAHPGNHIENLPHHRGIDRDGHLPAHPLDDVPRAGCHHGRRQELDGVSREEGKQPCRPDRRAGGPKDADPRLRVDGQPQV